jgi:hypothetical protein
MLGIYPGSVSALALINDTEGRVELFADSELLGREFIDCHPADNACTLRMKTKDLLERFVPATGHACTPIVIERAAPQPSKGQRKGRSARSAPALGRAPAKAGVLRTSKAGSRISCPCLCCPCPWSPCRPWP